jgi:hypothetical protein
VTPLKIDRAALYIAASYCEPAAQISDVYIGGWSRCSRRDFILFPLRILSLNISGRRDQVSFRARGERRKEARLISCEAGTEKSNNPIHPGKSHSPSLDF